MVPSMLILGILVLVARISAVPYLIPPQECSPGLFENQYATKATKICGSTCREETHSALLEVYGMLSKDAPPGDLKLWPQQKAPCEACTRCRNITCPPGPPYCCWRGVNCCRDFKKIAPDTDCDLYSVVRLSLRTLGLNATLDGALPALQTLHKWGLMYLELDGNHLHGTIPSKIASLQDLRGLSLSNNGECDFAAVGAGHCIVLRAETLGS
jgi:hypothetical protein